jgi:hypothetical protein
MQALLQGAGGERQAARRLADPEIDAARREGGQQVKVFRDLIGAIVLEHDAAGPKTDPPGVAQQPGDNQLRRGARQLIGIVVFGDPEAVVAPGFGVLRQR